MEGADSPHPELAEPQAAAAEVIAAGAALPAAPEPVMGAGTSADAVRPQTRAWLQVLAAQQAAQQVQLGSPVVPQLPPRGGGSRGQGSNPGSRRQSVAGAQPPQADQQQGAQPLPQPQPPEPMRAAQLRVVDQLMEELMQAPAADPAQANMLQPHAQPPRRLQPLVPSPRMPVAATGGPAQVSLGDLQQLGWQLNAAYQSKGGSMVSHQSRAHSSVSHSSSRQQVEVLREALAAQQGEQQEKLHAVQEDVQAVQGDVHAVQEDVHAVQVDVHAVQGGLQAVQGEVQAVRGDVQAVQGNVQAALGELHQVSAAIDRLAQMQSQLMGTPSALSTQQPTAPPPPPSSGSSTPSRDGPGGGGAPGKPHTPTPPAGAVSPPAVAALPAYLQPRPAPPQRLTGRMGDVKCEDKMVFNGHKPAPSDYLRYVRKLRRATDVNSSLQRTEVEWLAAIRGVAVAESSRYANWWDTVLQPKVTAHRAAWRLRRPAWEYTGEELPAGEDGQPLEGLWGLFEQAFDAEYCVLTPDLAARMNVRWDSSKQDMMAFYAEQQCLAEDTKAPGLSGQILSSTVRALDTADSGNLLLIQAEGEQQSPNRRFALSEVTWAQLGSILEAISRRQVGVLAARQAHGNQGVSEPRGTPRAPSPAARGKPAAAVAGYQQQSSQPQSGAKAGLDKSQWVAPDPTDQQFLQRRGPWQAGRSCAWHVGTAHTNADCFSQAKLRDSQPAAAAAPAPPAAAKGKYQPSAKPAAAAAAQPVPQAAPTPAPQPAAASPSQLPPPVLAVQMSGPPPGWGYIIPMPSAQPAQAHVAGAGRPLPATPVGAQPAPAVLRCNNCDGTGHWARDCPSPRKPYPRPAPRAHAAAPGEGDGGAASLYAALEGGYDPGSNFAPGYGPEDYAQTAPRSMFCVPTSLHALHPGHASGVADGQSAVVVQSPATLANLNGQRRPISYGQLPRGMPMPDMGTAVLGQQQPATGQPVLKPNPQPRAVRVHTPPRALRDSTLAQRAGPDVGVVLRSPTPPRKVHFAEDEEPQPVVLLARDSCSTISGFQQLLDSNPSSAAEVLQLHLARGQEHPLAYVRPGSVLIDGQVVRNTLGDSGANNLTLCYKALSPLMQRLVLWSPHFMLTAGVPTRAGTIPGGLTVTMISDTGSKLHLQVSDVWVLEEGNPELYGALLGSALLGQVSAVVHSFPSPHLLYYPALATGDLTQGLQESRITLIPAPHVSREALPVAFMSQTPGPQQALLHRDHDAAPWRLTWNPNERAPSPPGRNQLQQGLGLQQQGRGGQPQQGRGGRQQQGRGGQQQQGRGGQQQQGRGGQQQQPGRGWQPQGRGQQQQGRGQQQQGRGQQQHGRNWPQQQPQGRKRGSSGDPDRPARQDRVHWQNMRRADSAGSLMTEGTLMDLPLPPHVARAVDTARAHVMAQSAERLHVPPPPLAHQQSVDLDHSLLGPWSDAPPAYQHEGPQRQTVQPNVMSERVAMPPHLAARIVHPAPLVEPPLVEGRRTLVVTADAGIIEWGNRVMTGRKVLLDTGSVYFLVNQELSPQLQFEEGEAVFIPTPGGMLRAAHSCILHFKWGDIALRGRFYPAPLTAGISAVMPAVDVFQHVQAKLDFGPRSCTIRWLAANGRIWPQGELPYHAGQGVYMLLGGQPDPPLESEDPLIGQMAWLYGPGRMQWDRNYRSSLSQAPRLPRAEGQYYLMPYNQGHEDYTTFLPLPARLSHPAVSPAPRSSTDQLGRLYANRTMSPDWPLLGPLAHAGAALDDPPIEEGAELTVIMALAGASEARMRLPILDLASMQRMSADSLIEWAYQVLHIEESFPRYAPGWWGNSQVIPIRLAAHFMQACDQARWERTGQVRGTAVLELAGLEPPPLTYTVGLQAYRTADPVGSTELFEAAQQEMSRPGLLARDAASVAECVRVLRAPLHRIFDYNYPFLQSWEVVPAARMYREEEQRRAAAFAEAGQAEDPVSRGDSPDLTRRRLDVSGDVPSNTQRPLSAAGCVRTAVLAARMTTRMTHPPREGGQCRAAEFTKAGQTEEPVSRAESPTHTSRRLDNSGDVPGNRQRPPASPHACASASGGPFESLGRQAQYRAPDPADPHFRRQSGAWVPGKPCAWHVGTEHTNGKCYAARKLRQACPAPGAGRVKQAAAGSSQAAVARVGRLTLSHTLAGQERQQHRQHPPRLQGRGQVCVARDETPSAEDHRCDSSTGAPAGCQQGSSPDPERRASVAEWIQIMCEEHRLLEPSDLAGLEGFIEGIMFRPNHPGLEGQHLDRSGDIPGNRQRGLSPPRAAAAEQPPPLAQQDGVAWGPNRFLDGWPGTPFSPHIEPHPSRSRHDCDRSLPMILHAYYSPLGLHAALTQRGPTGFERLVASAQSYLPGEAMHLSSFQGEAYAVAWAVRVMSPHIHSGNAFTLVAPVRSARWILNIVHRGMMGSGNDWLQRAGRLNNFTIRLVDPEEDVPEDLQNHQPARAPMWRSWPPAVPHHVALQRHLLARANDIPGNRQRTPAPTLASQQHQPGQHLPELLHPQHDGVTERILQAAQHWVRHSMDMVTGRVLAHSGRGPSLLPGTAGGHETLPPPPRRPPFTYPPPPHAACWPRRSLPVACIVLIQRMLLALAGDVEPNPGPQGGVPPLPPRACCRVGGRGAPVAHTRQPAAGEGQGRARGLTLALMLRTYFAVLSVVVEVIGTPQSRVDYAQNLRPAFMQQDRPHQPTTMLSSQRFGRHAHQRLQIMLLVGSAIASTATPVWTLDDPQSFTALHPVDSYSPEGLPELPPDPRYHKTEGGWVVLLRDDCDQQKLQELHQLVESHKDVMAYSLKELPGYSGPIPAMTIPLIDPDKVTAEHKRRDSELEKEVADEKCQDLAGASMIRPSSSWKYAMNNVVAAKKDADGAWSEKRFCQDARPVNANTIPDPHVPPTVDELFQRIGDSTWLTKVDMRAAFNQIPIAPEDQEKTTFYWGNERWCYTRCFYGLRNATAQFQKVMDYHLQHAGFTAFTVCYVDDLVIHSRTLEEHIDHVDRVFRMLKSIGLRAHPGKTLVGADYLEFLGHLVTGNGIAPEHARVASLVNLKAPTSVHQCRSVFGLFNFYRCYIPGFSVLSAPISALLKKTVQWGPGTWGPEQEAALDALKLALSTPGVGLWRYDPSLPLLIYSDWSQLGISAVLGQRDADGNERLVACVSRSLNIHERNYPSYKGEMLAAVWAAKTLRPYIWGRPFTLITDHEPLRWLMTNRNLTGQYARWAMSLQEFDFQVVHRAGEKHQNADALSRLPDATEADFTGARLDNAFDPVPPPPEFIEGTPFPQRTYYNYNFPLPAHLMGRPPAVEVGPEPPPRGHLSELLAAGERAQSPMAALALVASSGRTQLAAQRAVQALAAPIPVSVTLDADDLLQGDEGLPHSLQIAYADTSALPTAWPSRKRRQQRAAQRVRLHRAELVAERPRPALPLLPVGDPAADMPSFSSIDTALVDAHALTAAGVTLYEPFGGLCAGLEMCLRSGLTVHKYLYSDIDPKARMCAQHRLEVLQQQYPEQLPPGATSYTFTALPQDVTQVGRPELIAAGACDDSQWLLVAGWECQDNSSAGSGLGVAGKRSRTFFDVVRMVGLLQQLQPLRPPAYLLENAPMQHNFRHPQVRDVEYPRVCAVIGEPVLLDAAQFGARAHRMRNFWTNLASTQHLQQVLEGFPRPDHYVQDILDPGWVPAPVLYPPPLPFYQCNVAGEPRRALPTFVARFPESHAYVPGQPGRLYSLDGSQSRPPNANERELALGYAKGTTAAPGLTEEDRHAITGRCMDAVCLAELLAHCLALRDAGLTVSHPPTPPAPRSRQGGRHGDVPGSGLAALCWALTAVPQDEAQYAVALAAAADEQEAGGAANPFADIWQDVNCLEMIRDRQVSSTLTAAELRRVIRRSKAYRAEGSKLHRVMPDGSTKLCPSPQQRHELIKSAHTQLGHFGVRRTAALLRLSYWWQGLQDEVQQLVSTCSHCARANVGGTSRPDQLNPLPIMGPFYRWGIDLAGPLPTTPRGNKYVMVAIEHFSKHIELIALPDKTAATTARALLDIIARFGAPAEVVTDQGTEFLGAFEALLKRCYIDHRTTSASHPQSNGASERIVQVVKKSLRKRAEEQQLADEWDDWLPWLALGYRCSPQASTKCSPYYLLHGVHPVVPPAVHEVFEAPLNFENTEESVFRIMEHRARRIQQAVASAGQNLAIAQHRDTLRYSRTRSGAHKPRVLRFETGDYVYTRRGKVGSTMQMPVHPEIYRVVSVNPAGVAILQGSCGTTMAQHVQNLLPCHLQDIDPRIDPRLRPSDLERSCEECGESYDDAMLMGCDSCDRHYHYYCLKDDGGSALGRKPSHPFVCPHCASQGVSAQDVQQLWHGLDLQQVSAEADAAIPASDEEMADPQPSARAGRSRARAGGARRRSPSASSPASRPTKPTAEQAGPASPQPLDSDADPRAWWDETDLTGQRIALPFFVGGQPVLYEGTLRRLPAARFPYLYAVRFDDGKLLHYNAEGLSAGRLLTLGRAVAAAAVLLRLPQRWRLETAVQVQEAIQALRPVAPPPFVSPTAVAALSMPVDSPGLGGITPSEVLALCLAVDISAAQVVVDPWPSTGLLASELRMFGLSVHSSASLSVRDTLQPAYYTQLERQFGPLHAVFFTALPSLLDLALPLAAEFATHAVFARVPARYLFNPSASRREWLQQLQGQGRLLVLSGTPDMNARHRCLWLCVFRSCAVRERMMAAPPELPSLLLIT